MKKIILIVLLSLGCFTISESQEWMTSLDVAKNLAFIQDKLLFVIWEDVSFEPYPVLIRNKKGNSFVVDLFANESLNELIWDHFVPVIISEYQYPELYQSIKGKRSKIYIDKFNDDTIKIMDVNGNIVNTSIDYYDYLDIIKFTAKYAMNTGFLKAELANYRELKDFNTTYRLASKYIDFAILVGDDVREEILRLSDYYLQEAKGFITNESSEELVEKIELQNLKQILVLGKAKKVLRQLKRMSKDTIEVSNEPLVAFLYFTAYAVLKDETKASVWRSKVSLVNLKKANLIVKNIS